MDNIDINIKYYKDLLKKEEEFLRTQQFCYVCGSNRPDIATPAAIDNLIKLGWTVAIGRLPLEKIDLFDHKTTFTFEESIGWLCPNPGCHNLLLGLWEQP